MTKLFDDSVPDAALNAIKNGATSMIVCAGDPADLASAQAAELASVAMAPADYTVANGDASGRKVTAGAKSPVTSAGGTPTHLVHVDATKILLKTECSLQGGGSLGVGQTINIPAHKLEIADPV